MSDHSRNAVKNHASSEISLYVFGLIALVLLILTWQYWLYDSAHDTSVLTGLVKKIIVLTGIESAGHIKKHGMAKHSTILLCVHLMALAGIVYILFYKGLLDRFAELSARQFKVTTLLVKNRENNNYIKGAVFVSLVVVLACQVVFVYLACLTSDEKLSGSQVIGTATMVIIFGFVYKLRVPAFKKFEVHTKEHISMLENDLIMLKTGQIVCLLDKDGRCQFTKGPDMIKTSHKDAYIFPLNFANSELTNRVLIKSGSGQVQFDLKTITVKHNINTIKSAAGFQELWEDFSDEVELERFAQNVISDYKTVLEEQLIKLVYSLEGFSAPSTTSPKNQSGQKNKTNNDRIQAVFALDLSAGMLSQAITGEFAARYGTSSFIRAVLSIQLGATIESQIALIRTQIDDMDRRNDEELVNLRSAAFEQMLDTTKRASFPKAAEFLTKAMSALSGANAYNLHEDLRATATPEETTAPVPDETQQAARAIIQALNTLPPGADDFTKRAVMKNATSFVEKHGIDLFDLHAGLLQTLGADTNLQKDQDNAVASVLNKLSAK